MSIKDLFKSVEETEKQEGNGTEIKDLFPNSLKNIYGEEIEQLDEKLSKEEITEDLTGEKSKSLLEFEEENTFGTDVVLYPPKGNELSWEQTFKTEAGNCTISLSSKLALESQQLDEYNKQELLKKAKEALKVYSLPYEQEGFISRSSLIEANLTTPDKVIVVNEINNEVEPSKEREDFIEKVVEAGAYVTDNVEEAARYASSYLD